MIVRCISSRAITQDYQQSPTGAMALMALEVHFARDILNHNAGHLIAIIGAHPGNVELCRGAWLQAIANVTAAGGDVRDLEARCKLALGVDVWGLLETGGTT